MKRPSYITGLRFHPSFNSVHRLTFSYFLLSIQLIFAHVRQKAVARKPLLCLDTAGKFIARTAKGPAATHSPSQWSDRKPLFACQEPYLGPNPAEPRSQT